LFASYILRSACFSSSSKFSEAEAEAEAVLMPQEMPPYKQNFTV